METCERCGAELGVGRFCLNCGHPVGAPVDDHMEEFLPWVRTDLADEDAGGPPVMAADDPDEARPPWLPWLAGAVTLVVLLLVLVSCLGGDDESASENATRSETTPEQPIDTQGPGKDKAAKAKPVDVSGEATATAPVTAPPTQDLDGQTVTYGAAQMLDGLPFTSWRMEGDGSGTVLTFTLAEPTDIVRVGLINGYAKKVAGVDWYPNNRRITSARWTFDDGATLNQSFTQGPKMQTVKLKAETTTKVTLTITGVTAPGAGKLGRDYTAISEVRLIGRPTD